MHKNFFWLTFLIIIAAFTLWFTAKAGSSLFHYYLLSAQVPAHIEDWEIKELSSDHYALFAKYTYDFEGKQFQGEEVFRKNYPNPWAAERMKKIFLNKEWQVWLNPKKPYQAALEKRFPVKRTLSAAILVSLAGYFICLGLYVGGKNGTN